MAALTEAQRLAARKALAVDQLEAIDAAIAILNRPALTEIVEDLGKLNGRFPAGSGAGETWQNILNILGQAKAGMEFRRTPIAAEVASYEQLEAAKK